MNGAAAAWISSLPIKAVDGKRGGERGGERGSACGASSMRTLTSNASGSTRIEQKKPLPSSDDDDASAADPLATLKSIMNGDHSSARRKQPKAKAKEAVALLPKNPDGVDSTDLISDLRSKVILSEETIDMLSKKLELQEKTIADLTSFVEALAKRLMEQQNDVGFEDVGSDEEC